MKKLVLSSALCVVLGGFYPAQAQEFSTESNTDKASLSFGIGRYDIFDDADTATDYRIEYRHGTPILWKLKPWGGAEATGDGSIWAGGGLLADFHAAPNLYITPSVGAGLYSQGGSDLDLGSAIEFRTQIEGGYEFTNGHRLGVAFGHTSNAGLGDRNPGAEHLNLYYHMPINNLF